MKNGNGQTTLSKPWNIKDLRNTSNMANILLSKGIGYKPYQGPTYAPWASQTQEGLDQMESIARAGSPGIQSALGFTNNMTANNGMSQELNDSLNPLRAISSGQDAIGAGAFQSILGDAGQQTAADQYLRDTAEGKYLNSNPHLMQALQSGAEKIQLQSALGAAAGGRYGGGAAAAGTARALGDYYAAPLAQNYENERSRMLQATGMIDSAQQGRIAGMTGAAQGLANVEGTNIANRANAAGQEANFLNMGLNRGMTAAQLAPMLREAEYGDAQKLLGIGAAYEDKTQQGIDSAIDLWNKQQAWPWEQLMRANAIFSGMGGFGGSQVQSGGNNSAASILGGAMGGLGLYGQLAKYGIMGANPWLGLGMGGLGALAGGLQ